MTLTEEQSGFLSMLRETGFIRRDQVLPLRRLHTPKKTAEQAEGLLRRLAYLGRLVRLPDGTLFYGAARRFPWKLKMERELIP